MIFSLLPVLLAMGNTASALPADPVPTPKLCSPVLRFGPVVPFHIGAVPRTDNTSYYPLHTTLNSTNSGYGTELVLAPSGPLNASFDPTISSLFTYDNDHEYLIANRSSITGVEPDNAIYANSKYVFRSKNTRPGSHLTLSLSRDENAEGDLAQTVEGPCDAKPGTINYLEVLNGQGGGGDGSGSDPGLYQWAVYDGATSLSLGCPDGVSGCEFVALKIFATPGSI